MQNRRSLHFHRDQPGTRTLGEVLITRPAECRGGSGNGNGEKECPSRADHTRTRREPERSPATADAIAAPIPSIIPGTIPTTMTPEIGRAPENRECFAPPSR